MWIMIYTILKLGVIFLGHPVDTDDLLAVTPRYVTMCVIIFFYVIINEMYVATQTLLTMNQLITIGV